MTIQHKDLSQNDTADGEGIHPQLGIPDFANQAARLAYTQVAGERGAHAWQISDGTTWQANGAGGWKEVAASGGGGGAVAASDIEAYMTLNGANERIDLGPATELRFDNTDPFSVAFWFKILDGGIDNQVIGNLISAVFQGWEIDIDGGDILANFISNGNGQIAVRTSAAVNDGTWRHGVVTYDGSSDAAGITIYVDGSSVALTVNTDTLVGTIVANENARIGSRQANDSYYFDGSLSDVGVYDIELSAANVTAISDACDRDLTTVGPTGDLVGYWKMGFSSTPLIAEDLSANSNDGIVVGAPDIRVGGPCGG